MSAIFDFRGRRRDLALVFREERTAREAARELGTETGSIYGLIKRMHAEGILEADSDPDPPTRGTQYRLTMRARIALDEALREAALQGELGQLTDSQRVLVVSPNGFMVVQEVLSDAGLSAAVAWGAMLGGDWLLAMAPDSALFTAQKLAAAFEQAGCVCRLERIDGLKMGTHLREQAGGHLERAEAVR